MTQELTADDITTGTELVYQSPSYDYTNDRDYTTPTRGTVVEIVEETKHLVSSTLEQTMVIIETEDGEKRIDIDNLVGETDFRVGIVGEDDEDEDNEDEDGETTEVVADGGDDTTDHLEDGEIVAAIEQHDDPDHPDATTVAEARTLLGDVQASIEEYWSEHMDAIDDDHMSVVYEDADVIVLADHTGHGWNEERDALDLRNDIVGDVLKSVHHKTAERLCSYSWSASDPFVVAKPDDWQLGETHVERRVAQLATAADVSEAAAMDYWSVEIKGRSQSQWARMVGKSQQTVSENIQKVEDGFLTPELS